MTSSDDDVLAESAKLALNELTGQIWELDARDVAFMLSPSQLRDKQESTSFANLFRGVESHFITGHLQLAFFAPHVAPDYIHFLNACARACADAYSALASEIAYFNVPERTWWDPSMRFHVCDMVMDAQRTAHEYEQGISVVVNIDWMALLEQAAVHASIMMDMVPLREFALVIAINSDLQELRFLIFHRGGTTASEALQLDRAAGRHKILQVLFFVYLWQTPEDTGLPSFVDGVSICLPDVGDDMKAAVLDIKRILFYRPCVRGRGTFVAACGPPKDPKVVQPSSKKATPSAMAAKISMTEVGNTTGAAHDSGLPIFPDTLELDGSHEPVKYHAQGVRFNGAVRCVLQALNPVGDVVIKAAWQLVGKRRLEANILEKCRGQFGVPRLLDAFEVKGANHVTVSNSRVLPEQWSPVRTELEQMFERDEEPEKRFLQVLVFEGQGKTLDTSTTGIEIMSSILHALLGWLTYFMNGYLHKDISIGNILVLETPLECQPFKVDTKRACFETDLGKKALREAEILQQKLDTLDISGQCMAILNDPDMAACMDGYFDSVQDRVTSGNVDFMSDLLRKAYENGYPYIHTPVDDMHSAFLTAVWAMAFNVHEPELDFIRRWQEDLQHTLRFRQGVVFEAVLGRALVSPLVSDLRPALRAWFYALEDLQVNWDKELESLPDDYVAPECMFYEYAYRGVSLFIDVYLQYRNKSY